MPAGPLNPELYHALVSAFGDVRIARQGEKAPDFTPIRSLLATRVGADGLRRYADKPRGGEEYRVNCPFCNDTKHRLYVNHRWGALDDQDGDWHWYLANCFNEDCLSEPFRLVQFKLRVFAFGPAGQRVSQLRPGQAPKRSAHVEPPGRVLRLSELPAKHVAREYLIGRGWDLGYLEHLWRVGWCQTSRFRLARQRIYIPLFFRNELRFWQCRHPADDYFGKTFKEADVPKYWGCPGAIKDGLAYNLERALRFRTVYVVEGPADCWSAGPRAIGVWGKTISLTLVRKMRSIIRRHGLRLEDMTFLVVLDPEQDAREKAKGKPHHIEKACKTLQQLGPCRVLPLYLPQGLDPGGCESQWFRGWVKATAWKEHRVRLSFDRPVGA